MTGTDGDGDGAAARQRRMSLVARSRLADIEAAWAALGEVPAHAFLRAPETGLAMVRARAGGDGDKFNLGEMTLTRCVVRLASGETGVGYVQGRSARHAELAALADALAVHPAWAERIEHGLLRPLAARLASRDQVARARAASSRVEFFTMERGAEPGGPRAGDAA